MPKIAVDAMGGDDGLSTSLPGIIHFLNKYPKEDVEFAVFGNKVQIECFFAQHPYNCKIEIIDTGQNVIQNDENPIHAIRNSRGTSMYEAISSVAEGSYDAVVSSGNTGAYMVLSKLLIGTISGVIRPALVNVLPTKRGKTIMLDLGANTDCTADKLHQFAVMGKAVSAALLGLDNPIVGLLNIGVEKSKGTEALGIAYELLSNERSLNFCGFIEGNNIMDGSVDVIVTDGFSGNIALKTLEGTVKFMISLIKNEILSNHFAKIGYLLGFRNIFNSLRKKIEPSLYNGAPFVGLKSVVVKSHGGSDYIGFAHAIHTSAELVRNEFIKHIRNYLGDMND